MKVDANKLFSLEILSIQQRGILTTRDLEVIFRTSNRHVLKNRLHPYLKENIIIRFCRGFYIVPKATTPETALINLSQRICPHSIISLGTILSKSRLIGTHPKNIVYAVKVGKSRKYEHKTYGQIIHFGFGGIESTNTVTFGDTWEKGIRYAEPERALLDTLYFYQKGNKYFFNIYSDIDIKLINRRKYLDYLKKYPNSRFRAFARRYIDEKIRS